jgi:hypothetical protein
MITRVPDQIVIDPAVPEFLKQHDAEEDFKTGCALVRECFPEMLSLRAKLQEDWDEPDWIRVVLEVKVPAAHPLDLLSEQRKRFINRFLEAVPLDHVPLFLLREEFAAG